MEKLDFKKLNVPTDGQSVTETEMAKLGIISEDTADQLAMEEPKEDETSLSYILAHGTKMEWMDID
ncbi:MAG: hypothetical protein IKK93_12045 [Campylobacter sp.]|nr:hypothetical protein [Campylobacter sp.]